MKKTSSEASRSAANVIAKPRYSLRLLLIAMSVAAVVLAVWASKVEPYRQQFAGLTRFIDLVNHAVDRINSGAGSDRGLLGYAFDIDEQDGSLTKYRKPDGSALARSLVSMTLGSEKYVEYTKLRFPAECEPDDIEFVLSRMRHLEFVALDGNALTAKTLRTVGRIPLKTASLRYCDISDSRLAEMNGAGIKILYLTGNPITDKSIDSLATLRELEQLYLRWTDMTEQGVSDLRRKLPDCEIHFTE